MLPRLRRRNASSIIALFIIRDWMHGERSKSEKLATCLAPANASAFLTRSRNSKFSSASSHQLCVATVGDINPVKSTDTAVLGIDNVQVNSV